LAVKYGEVIGILGPNGAGKTTLVKTIAGLKECSSGKIKRTRKILLGLSRLTLKAASSVRMFLPEPE
jgi:ABC-type sulfate/molybdate transport systems ATPase subunit